MDYICQLKKKGICKNSGAPDRGCSFHSKDEKYILDTRNSICKFDFKSIVESFGAKMAKITIEDECGEEKIFTTDEKTVEKIKTCLVKKTNEVLGVAESSCVKMMDGEGDVVVFFLKREVDGNINVMSYLETEKQKSAEIEVIFEINGNNISTEGHYFS